MVVQRKSVPVCVRPAVIRWPSGSLSRSVRSVPIRWSSGSLSRSVRSVPTRWSSGSLSRSVGALSSRRSLFQRTHQARPGLYRLGGSPTGSQLICRQRLALTSDRAGQPRHEMRASSETSAATQSCGGSVSAATPDLRTDCCLFVCLLGFRGRQKRSLCAHSGELSNAVCDFISTITLEIS